MRSPNRFLPPLAAVLVVSCVLFFVFHPADQPAPEPPGESQAETPAATTSTVAGAADDLNNNGGPNASIAPPGLTTSADPAARPAPAFPALLRPAREGAVREPAYADAAQSTARPASDPAVLPVDFLDRMLQASDQRVGFVLPDGSAASGTVELLRKDADGVLLVQGRLELPAPGAYFFQRQTMPGVAGAMVGNVRFDHQKSAWRIDPAGPDGTPVLNAVRLDQVICTGSPLPPENAAAETASLTPQDPGIAPGTSPENPGSPQYVPQTHPTNMTIPVIQNGVVPLQSLPGATGVIYLDFDGEPGPFAGWGSVKGDAAPSGTSNTDIKEIWQRVSEDFQPFNLNVTTDRRVYDSASETSRQHVVVSPTSEAAPGAGGVAFIGSFNWAGNTVCWSFLRSGKGAAEAISHEVGHTLGLGHDGRNSPSEDYFGGHGSGDTGWAPLMGVGYGQNLTQWSRGEYTGANNTEDDLSIITNNNNTVDYRVDDTTALYATADYLEILNNYAVSSEGIIETRTDVDAWRFQSAGGSASLTVSTVNQGPNVDLQAQIYNSANTLIATSNPAGTLGATVTATLPAGDYTLRVSGVGKGVVTGDGYSDYASLGAYLITGSVTNGVRSDRFSVAENTANGTVVGTVTKRLNHGTNDLAYAITSGNTGLAFSINAATGQLSVANSAILNYETLSTRWDDPATMELFIGITDTVDPSLNETMRVVVTVTPINEAPVVTGGTVTMFTRTLTAAPVFRVAGSDPDRFDFPLFSILSGNTGGAFALDANSGQLTTTAAFPAVLPDEPFTLVIRGTDRGAPARTTDATVTVNVREAPAGFTPGAAMRTYFENINGNNVSNLTGSSRFPNAPDAEELAVLLDDATHGDNYGSTLRGYLLPPASGSYTFWIASDDASEFRLSPNATPTSAVVRASASGATGRYQYDRYTSQKSTAINLTAGVPYYFEARHKEGGGDDHLVLAWQGPGFTRQIITGLHLAPFRQNYAPKIAAQSFPVRRGAESGTAVGTVAATDVNSADLRGSYTITGGSASAWCAIDANTGLIYITNPAAVNNASAATYNLTVRVADNASPSLTGSGTITLNMLAPDAINTTGIVQQFWNNISGNNVSALTSNSRYPNAPSSTRILTGFDTGADFSENYGSRIRAWVVPPATGSYTFYIAGDDECQLRFTTGTNYTSAAQIASIVNATGRNEWTNFSSQRSAAFTLTAGRLYYMEVRQKEGIGGDFVQVGWTGPGITSPVVIPSSALRPYDYNIAPVWSSPAYQFTVKQSAAHGSAVGAVSGTDVDGAQLVYTITAGNTAGAIAINPFTGALSVANRAALVPGQVISLTLRLQDNGVSGMYPYKTAAATANITVQPDFMLVRPAGAMANLPARQGLELEALPSGRAGAVPAWTMVSGPGTVTFDDPAAYRTGAVFSTDGFYQLRGTETAGGIPLTVDLMVQAGAVTALPGGERIGVQNATPTHTLTDGSWQIQSGGTGLLPGTSDSFYFIDQPATGNATITARITGVQNVSANNSLAGLMLRESPAADARFFFCGVTSQNGRRALLRTTAGLASLTSGTETNPATPFEPCWVRITRVGNVFTALTAPDNAGTPGTFTPLGAAQTFPMASSYLIGMAASSGISATRGTAGIENLTIAPSSANLAPLISAGAPATAGTSAATMLDGLVTDDARPVLPGAVTALWTKISGPGTADFADAPAADTTVAFSAEGAYRLRLSADDGEVRTFRDVSLAVTGSALSNLELWRQTAFTSDAADPLIAGDLADPDQDGLANLLEYVLDREPRTADTPGLVLDITEVDGIRYLRLTASRNPSATDVPLIIETTTTPGIAASWTPAGTVVEEDTTTTLRARTQQSLDAFPAQFLRLRATH